MVSRERSLPVEFVGLSAGAFLIMWLVATMSLWFFAFYPLAGEAPEWVRRAQLACFGSSESGLPGASGWILLVFSPLAFLVAILVSHADDLRDARAAMFRTRVSKVSFSVLSLLIVVEAVWVGRIVADRLQGQQQARSVFEGGSLPESYPRGDSPAPDFSLIDQDGAVQSLSALQGSPVLLSFVFAHCQAACPTIVKSLTAVTKDSSVGRSVHMMLVTLDPWRDTPAALPTLATRWALGERMKVLSGTVDEVTSVLDAYKVPRERNGTSGDVAHPAIVHVINPRGELSYSFVNPSEEWLREALRRVVS